MTRRGEKEASGYADAPGLGRTIKLEEAIMARLKDIGHGG